MTVSDAETQRAHDLATLKPYQLANGDYAVDLNDGLAMEAFQRVFVVTGGEWRWPSQFRPVLYVEVRPL